MKKWRTASEWMAYSLCWADPRFTADELDDADLAVVADICSACPVAVECAEWALQKKVTGVVAAGVHVPDPGGGLDPHTNKAGRRLAYSVLRKWLREQVDHGKEV